jgi:hypothetical protein
LQRQPEFSARSSRVPVLDSHTRPKLAERPDAAPRTMPFTPATCGPSRQRAGTLTGNCGAVACGKSREDGVANAEAPSSTINTLLRFAAFRPRESGRTRSAPFGFSALATQTQASAK